MQSNLSIPRVKGLEGRRAVITGGAGFIGSSLTRVLLASGAEVVVYDNLVTGTRDNLYGCKSEVERAPTFVNGDVRDREKLLRLLKPNDLVFNLACLGVRHSIHSPFENLDVNARGTLTVLSASRTVGAERVVHVSSSEVYGTARHVPMTEDHTTDPHTVYGASKLDGECQARAFWRCYEYPTVILRPFNAYGPRSHFEGDSGEVIPRFLLRGLLDKPLVIFGDGSQTRDFTHVYDTAASIARAGVANDVFGETFNVGSGSELTINELAETLKKALDKPKLEIVHHDGRPGDVLRLFSDSTKAEKQLGHTLTVSLQDGLHDLSKRFLEAGPESLADMESNIVIKNWT